MHLFNKINYSLLVGIFLLIACEDVERPTALKPILNVEEAFDISRTTATLIGEVKKVGDGKVTELRFRYGTSDKMENEVTCDFSLSTPSVTLTELTPNTTYHYCLEAGNGYNSIQSSSRSFTTEPNRIPILKNLQFINQGPLSIAMQYELADDGGKPIISTGFYYRAENGEEKQWPMTSVSGSVFRDRINQLEIHTTYTIQPYATNSIGEARGEIFNFRTGEAVIVSTPGTLSEALGIGEKYLHTTLNISGPLNGTDIRFLRDMLGRDINGEATLGKMSALNLIDVTIKSGGTSYDGMRYTVDNQIGYGMFSSCDYLQSLVLPSNIVIIEENSFKNCTALTSLQIPAAALQLGTSENCSQLTSIEVATSNNVFCSKDGVLYNKECSQLLWFPEGKKDMPSFPSTLKSIGEYSFRNYSMKEINLPPSIDEIKKGAFYAAQLESITLPEMVKIIPYGVFQECRNLTSITLGSQLNYLSNFCFDRCPLQHLYVTTRDMPPVCQEHTFTEDIFKNCILHIPAKHMAIYRNSNYWGRFEKIVE